MELETVLYRVEGNVAVISLNRTKAMNSLNKQIFADLTVAFEEAKKDDNVRCVIMNGEGRAFCAGGDIAEMKTINTEEAFFDFMTVAGEFTTLLNTFPKPVIAAAHGAIAGAGTSLVMAADIALVADNAMFIVAFGQVGLIPDCACHYLLPRVVGPNRAKELMLTQRAVKADEMLTLGIANRVVPADQLMDEAGQQDRQGPPELLRHVQGPHEQGPRDHPGGPAEGRDRHAGCCPDERQRRGRPHRFPGEEKGQLPVRKAPPFPGLAQQGSIRPPAPPGGGFFLPRGNMHYSREMNTLGAKKEEKPRILPGFLGHLKVFPSDFSKRACICCEYCV